MDSLIQDVRYAVRMLLKHRGFTAVAILTLALGIGANSAIFALLDKTLIRPLPVERPDQLVTFVEGPSGESAIYSYPQYADLRDGNRALAGLAAFFQRPFSLNDGSQSQRVIGQVVSGNYFDVLNVRPALGRFFSPEEDRTPETHAVAVIGHGLWRRRFGANPSVIGQPIDVNGYRYTVIGVTPAEFGGVTPGTANDLYVPVMMQPRLQPGRNSMLENRNAGWLRLIGRLGPGVTRAQAEAALSALVEGPAPGEKAPKDQKDQGDRPGGVQLADGSHGYTENVGNLFVPLRLMMGAVGFVLLIACANVANLLIVRASMRRKEIAVRLAVGASRARLVRQLLTEGLLLAGLAGAAGLLVRQWFTSLLLGFEQQTSFVPRALDGSLDGRTLAFALGLSVTTGVLFSLAPAWSASRTDPIGTLKDISAAAGGVRRWSFRNLLVVTQVALSLVLLIGAGLCLKSLRGLQAIDPGFQPAKVLTASFDLGQNGYERARGRQVLEDLTRRLSALPGVEAVSFANIVAFSDLFWISGASIDGYDPQPGERLAFNFNAVSPDYFRTLGTPMLSGREFTPRDTADAPPVIVVNEAAARRYWPNQDPVGKRTSRGEVIGVVRNTRERGLTEDPRPTIYLSLLQSYQPELTLHVRAAGEAGGLFANVRREVQAIDPTLPLYNVRTLAEQKNGSLYVERLAATLLTLFGAVAVLLAAIGLYGVLSFTVTARTREIGIRLSQGARARDLIGLIVVQGMVPTIVGLGIGVAASVWLTRLLERLLFGVSATDPLTFAAIPLLLMAVALIACWIPGRRAARMNPVAALRFD